jgi:hypothetical protein
LLKEEMKNYHKFLCCRKVRFMEWGIPKRMLNKELEEGRGKERVMGE